MDARRLTYRLSPADYAALAAVPRVSERWWLIFLLAGAVFIGILIGWRGENHSWLAQALDMAPPFGEMAVIAVALACGYALFLLLRTIFRVVVARRLAREAGEIRLTAGPDGLTIADSRSTRMLLWRDIRHVAFGEERLMVAIADGAVILVPRSAFTGRAAMLSFANALEAALKADDAREEAGMLATGGAG